MLQLAVVQGLYWCWGTNHFGITGVDILSKVTQCYFMYFECCLSASKSYANNVLRHVQICIQVNGKACF